MYLLKEVSRTVFYGSVFSDILDGSHYAKLMITIGRILTDILKIPDSDKIWEPVNDFINEQAQKGDSLRGLSKEIFKSGSVT